MIEIKCTNENPLAITHAGIFHADEVFSSVLLGKILPEVRIYRTFKVPENLPEDVIVYDIGGGKYDHHQRGFNEMRPNGIKYSSFGLIWREFGMKLLASKNVPLAEEVFDLFDKSFVQGIDAVDNGQATFCSDVQIMSLSSIITQFNPNWDDTADADDCFLKAVTFAEVVFDNALANAISKAKARNGVESAIKDSNQGIMLLREFMPWQEFLAGSELEGANDILYVVFPSNRGGYNVQATRAKLGSFELRKPLPQSWRGLNSSALAEVTGVSTATFCHPGGFICGAETLDDALKLAKLAIKA